MWKLVDQSDGKFKGYLRIERDGKRVADVFPYVPGIDSAWTVQMARHIVDIMNADEQARKDVTEGFTEADIADIKQSLRNAAR